MTCEYVRFFIGVKSNEASRRNYQLQERKKREICAKTKFASMSNLCNFNCNKLSWVVL